MKRDGDLFINRVLVGITTILIVLMAIKFEDIQTNQLKYCDNSFNLFVKEHNGTMQNGVVIIRVNGVNITPFYQSFDDVVYSKKTNKNLRWTFFPIIAPKGTYIVPLLFFF